MAEEIIEWRKPKFCALCAGSDLIMIACEITYAVTYEETSIEYFCNQCKCNVKVNYKKDTWRFDPFYYNIGSRTPIVVTGSQIYTSGYSCDVKNSDKDVEFVPVDGKSVPYKEDKFKHVSI